MSHHAYGLAGKNLGGPAQHSSFSLHLHSCIIYNFYIQIIRFPTHFQKELHFWEG